VQKINFIVLFTTTLNLNCETQRVSKNLENNVEVRVRSQNESIGALSDFLNYFLRRKLCLKVTK
jgi:hypothetical protein